MNMNINEYLTNDFERTFIGLPDMQLIAKAQEYGKKNFGKNYFFNNKFQGGSINIENAPIVGTP